MANEATFINRISQALAQIAEVVRTEALEVAGHDRRRQFMLMVATDVNAYAYKVARMVAGNASIAAEAPDQSNVPDGDIVFAVSELWNTFTDIYVPVIEEV